MVRLFNRLVPGIVRRHKVLSSAVVFTVVAAILTVARQGTAAHYVLGIGSLILAVPLMRTMWDDFNTGAYGVNIIAIVALVTAVIIRQFWTAMAIVFAVILTKIVEQWAQNRTQRIVRAWLGRNAELAHIVHGKKVSDISPGKIHMNDRIIINPGEIVPVDSIVVSGSGSFDESPVVPDLSTAEKTVGDILLAGSINTDGIITARAVKTAAHSLVGEISRFVRSAANNQAHLMQLADRLTVPFTLLALALAITMWVVSDSPLRFLEVLVVATPLPLIATVPIAFNHGLVRSLRNGIVLRTGSTLERVAKLKAMAFTMIGILTFGEPTLINFLPFGKHTKDEILGQTAALGIATSHVLMHPIIQEAERRKLKLPKARQAHEVFNQGVTATIGGKKMVFGTTTLLDKYNIVPPAQPPRVKTGQHVWFLAVEGEVAGAFILEDAVRPEGPHSLTALRKLGLNQFIALTSSNAAAAKGVAKTLGLDEAYSAVTAARKLAIVSSVNHRPIGYVSNGVEDAPVLTAADVGFIMGVSPRTNTFDSADALLLTRDTSLLPQSVGIAKRTLAVAWQSIIIGVIFSIIAMAVFATGKVHPLYGVLVAFIINILAILSALRGGRGKS